MRGLSLQSWLCLRRPWVAGAFVCGVTRGVICGVLLGGSAVQAQPHPLDAAGGKALFERHWVPAPASTAASDGLGPFYNARACVNCHPAVGRGNNIQALTLRSLDPVYGRQLQPLALAGLEPELRYAATWVPTTLQLDDGSRIVVERLQVDISHLRYGALQSGWSARIAPGLAGLGLLQQVPEAAVLALADPDDDDGDGISGRPSWLSAEDGSRQLGRFGWKAEAADLAQQTALAFSLDLGLGTPLLPASQGDCSDVQGDCLQQAPGTTTGPASTEIGTELFDLVLAYLQALPAPIPRRESDVQALALFEQSGCAACHRPALPGPAGPVPAFTDLLLHDLGPGLADTLPTASAASSEWRTAPLWGLSAVRRYLHDGRAASVEQAILWHDGEARAARRAFRALSASEQRRLLDWLESL